VSISEYYAGGSYVAAGTVGFPGGVATPIPSSGAISLNSFKGSGKTYNMGLLIVGGGGGGGSGWYDNQGGGGGGGGGGGVYIVTLPITIAGFSGSISVGSGGTGGNLDAGATGGNSSITWTSNQYTSPTTSTGYG
jgi:hypothetical protein